MLSAYVAPKCNPHACPFIVAVDVRGALEVDVHMDRCEMEARLCLDQYPIPPVSHLRRWFAHVLLRSKTPSVNAAFCVYSLGLPLPLCDLERGTCFPGFVSGSRFWLRF